MVKVTENEKLTLNDIKEQIKEAWDESGMKDFTQRLKRIRKLSDKAAEKRKDYYNSVISALEAHVRFNKALGKKDEMRKTRAEIRKIRMQMNEPEFITTIKFLFEKCKNAFKQRR